MEIVQNAELKQEQTLSAAMIQSLSLLTLNVMDLKQAINAEIEKNPALEIPDSEFGADGHNSSSKGKTSFSSEGRAYNEDDEDSSFYEKTSYSGELSPVSSYGFDTPSAEETDTKNILEATLQNTESLYTHLIKQLGLTDADAVTRKIAELLIGSLDENGFFTLNLSELFKDTPYTDKQIKNALNLVQSFDPAGICCKDYKESLILQARLGGMKSSDLTVFSSIINNYMDDLKNGKFARIALKLHISEEDLSSFYKILKNLNPFPGALFGNNSESVIIPDATIHSVNGELVLDIDKSSLPPLRISEDFKKLANEHFSKSDKGAKTYIAKQIREAENFIGMIDMRFKTLYRTLLVIMEKQKDFFLNGPKHLHSLTLKEVANELDLSESTISRLCSSKWISTDWGLKPLKFFFSSGVKQTNVGKPDNPASSQMSSLAPEDAASSETNLSAASQNTDISKSSIKEIISEIIKEYGKISDQKISDKLAEKGIKIARRTVNKYRAELQ